MTRKTLRGQNAVLLVFSLLFYAWGGPVLLLLLLVLTFICWLGGRLLALRLHPFYRKTALFMTVAACVIIFVFFKYMGFLAETIRPIFGFEMPIPNIILPIGISFYTFQLVSYVADVYRGDTEAQTSYFTLLLYAALFHQCVAGPIVRYRDVAAELEERHATLADFSSGITRFAVGLGKKALLANAVGGLATTALAVDKLQTASAVTVLIGGACYMLQIYLDFSAYSDMAIGMGRMCGLHYCENFNYPYAARTVTDFWRRWHISLSSFFRDYVYIPLGGNRKGFKRQILNMLCVWMLTGLWHGASWNYVLWGLYYFVFLVLEKLFLGKGDKTPLWTRILQHVGLVLVVYFGWLLFYFENLSALGSALRAILCANGNPFSDMSARLLLLNNLFLLLVAAVACTPVIPFLQKQLERLGKGNPAWNALSSAIGAVVPTLLLFLSFLALIGNTYNPFLYFRF